MLVFSARVQNMPLCIGSARHKKALCRGKACPEVICFFDFDSDATAHGNPIEKIEETWF